MSTSNVFSKTALIGALTLACGALYSAPASAQNVPRSFYQNAGANCHGVDTLSDSKLTRTANRLINKTSSSVDVVCNLMTDVYGVSSTNFGVVTYVAIWARRNGGGASSQMSCTMTDGFFGQPGSTTYQPTGGNPKTLPYSGTQVIFEWAPADLNTNRFFGPVNVRCTMPGYSELNDWFVEYEVNQAPV